MSNVFYVPGKQRAARVGDLFASIARRYDLLNDLQSFGLHRLWKRRVVSLADAKPGDRALDLCCGTGDIAFALANRDLSGPGEVLEPLADAGARVTEDGERCFAAWCQSLSDAVAARVRLKLPPHEGFDGQPGIPFAAIGPSIVRRAAAK